MKKKHMFYGKVNIEVEGLNHAKLIENLRASSVVKGVESKARSLSFWCYEKDEIKIIAILKHMCYNYKILKRKGIAPALARVFARVGVVVGIVISVALLVLYPRMVLSLDVNDSDFESQTKEIMSEEGVKQFGFLWSLDCGKLEAKLLALDGISYAKVTRQGTSIVVQLERELPKPELLLESGKAVKSKKRATVTRTIVYAGTAVVKYGQIVEVGEVLIDGYILVGEEKVNSYASGEVYGKIYIERKVFFAKEEWQDDVGRVEQQERTSQLMVESTFTNGEIVTDKWFAHKTTEEGYIVTVTLECEVKISG